MHPHRWLIPLQNLSFTLLAIAAWPATQAQEQTLPPGVAADQWRRLSDRIEAQVDAELVAGESRQAVGGVVDVHGQVRTAVIVGDFSDLPDQNAADGPEFGFSVASHGDWLVVGAPGTVVESSGLSHGAVFVFRRGAGGWTLTQRAITIAGIHGARCGHSVALRLPHLMIGCPAYSPSAEFAGAGAVSQWHLDDDAQAFVYRGLGTVATTGLPANCGSALALTRNYLAFGCPAADDGAGRVRIVRRNPDDDSFHESSAFFEQLLMGNTLGSFGLGHALALYEPGQFDPAPRNVRLAVGAPGTIYDGSIWPRGSVHLFHRALDAATWNANATLHLSPPGSDGHALAGFGTTLAMNRTQLLVGAPNNRWGAVQTLPGPGTAHRYELLPIIGWTPREDGGGVNVPDGAHASMRFGDTVALGYDNLIAVAAPATDGRTTAGASADEVGLVELRRTGSLEWSVFHYAGEIRPPAINTVLVRDGGQFGASLTFDLSGRYLAVGYPRSGTTLQTRPRGSVWIYQPDLIFANGFQP